MHADRHFPRAKTRATERSRRDDGSFRERRALFPRTRDDGTGRVPRAHADEGDAARWGNRTSDAR